MLVEGENPSGRLTGGLNGRDKAITYWEDAAWVAYAHTYVSMPQFIQYTECLKKVANSNCKQNLKSYMKRPDFSARVNQSDHHGGPNWHKMVQIGLNSPR